MTYDEKKKFIVNVVFVVAAYAVLYFVFKYVIHWIMPFVVGFLITLALRPLTRFVTKLTGMKRKSIAILVVTMFYVIVALILWLLVTFLWAQTYDLIQVLPGFYATRIEPILFGFNDWTAEKATSISPEVANTVSNIITSAIQSVSSGIRSISLFLVELAKTIISNVPLYLISVIFTIVLSIFISVEFDNIVAFIKKQLPDRFNETFEGARKFLSGTLLKMIKAYAIILSITFIELFIGLSILRVKYALPIAAITAALDILPILGTGGVIIPWALVELLLKDYHTGFGLLILYVTITVVRNIIEPRIVGHEIGLHPIVTITVMYAGLRLFGFIGFILAPVIAILVKYLNDNDKIKLYK